MRNSLALTALILILSAASSIYSEDGVSPATNAIDLFFNNNVSRNLSIADHPYQVHLYSKPNYIQRIFLYRNLVLDSSTHTQNCMKALKKSDT